MGDYNVLFIKIRYQVTQEKYFILFLNSNVLYTKLN